MSVPIFVRVRPILALAVIAAACAPVARPHAPNAEFLVAASDSTLWVTSTDTGIVVKQSPVTFAHYDGHFFDVFAVDDDRSYQDALIVGVRVYRRDVTSGDSLLVFEDSVIPRIAAAYAVSHPGESPVGDQDNVDDDPSTQATSDVDMLELTGPYLSYRYRADIDVANGPRWHTAHNGVIDLRTGKPVTLAALFGDSAAQRVVAAGRKQYDAARSAAQRQSGGDGGTRAADVLNAATFDPASFALRFDDNDDLAVAFSVPLRGVRESESSLDLAEISVTPPAWWPGVQPQFATAAGEQDQWKRQHYSVLASYDSTGEHAKIAIKDSSGRAWPVVTVETPLHRIDWLDLPPLDSAVKNAVARAFSAAASGASDTHVATRDPKRGAVAVVLPVSLAERRTRRPPRL